METRILQESLVSSILYLIYISGVFYSVSKSCLLVTTFLFIDSSGFIVLGSLVKDVALVLGKVAKTVLQWGRANVVTYDTAKTKAIIFSKSY